MKQHLDGKCAPAMLAVACQFRSRLKVLVNECIPITASTFSSHTVDHLAAVPDDILVAILQHPKLQASPKDVSACLIQRLRLQARTPEGLAKRHFQKWAPFIHCVEIEDAAFLLGEALRFACEHARDVSLESIRRNFAMCRKGYLADILDHGILCQLLDSNELRCRDEDQVFDMIQEYCNINGDGLSKQRATELWERCRFVHLSPKKVAEAAMRADIPLQSLKLGWAGRILKEAGDSQDFPGFLEMVQGQKSASHMYKRLLPRDALPMPGDVLEAINEIRVRQGEDFDSPKACRLPEGTLVTVLRRGGGRRVFIGFQQRADSGCTQGWASIERADGRALLRPACSWQERSGSQRSEA